MKKIRGSLRLVLALGIVAVASVLVLAPASVAFADDPLGAQIAQVREATVHFHDVETALTAGYAQFLSCIRKPGEGAMGIHFFKREFTSDAILDPLRPEMLLYEPVHGELHLVAVKYLVDAGKWHAEHPPSELPSLFGQTFQLVDRPNDYLRQPPFYELHLWAWKHNPNGMFYPWNPTVTCW